MKKLKGSKLINITIKSIFLILFTLIIILLIFVDWGFLPMLKTENYICLGIITFVLLVGVIFSKIYKNRELKLLKKLEKNEKIIIRVIFITLFIFQIFLLENIYFEANWDVKEIYDTAERYAKTGIFENNSFYLEKAYFDVYPNNLFLASVFAIIIDLLNNINVINVHKVLIVISIILVDIAGIMAVKTIGNFTNNKLCKIGVAILYTIFIGLSPWFLIPYSDTYSIAIPISILYNYTKRNKKWYNYLLIGLLSYLGYLIKPTNIIILIAIIIVEIFKLMSTRKLRLISILKNIILVLVGVLIILLCNTGLQKIIGYKEDKEAALSLYHYLMMGINQRSCGAYYDEDLINSISIEGYDKRIEYNKKVFMERLTEFSFVELCEFYARKVMLIYNDGVFEWSTAGSFYKGKYEESVGIENALKNFYYRDGNAYKAFYNIMHTIWLFILITMLIGVFLKKNNYKYSVIYLSLIGITLFILLFEARSRYLYIYLPFYVILSILGLKTIKEKLKICKKKCQLKK